MDWLAKRSLVARKTIELGRPVTMIKDGSPADPTDPLGGSIAALTIENVHVVFVSPGGDNSLGALFTLPAGLWREAEQIGIVLPSMDFSFAEFTRVREADGAEWKIVQYDELKPATVPVVAYLGLRR